MISCFQIFRHRAGWLTLAIVLFMQADMASAGQIDGDRLLDPNHLIEIRIDIPAADWTRLCRQSRNPAALFSGLPTEKPYTYFKADLWVDGVEIESVGIRKKGFFGSVDSERPSLKIKFDEYIEQHPINGLSRLTLNNNKQDRAQVSQFLAYRLFRNAGNPAPRSNWAHVIVNGESLGIYSNVESIKKPFLARSFQDATGNLYEGTVTDFHPSALEKIEVKTNEGDNDLSDIERLAKLLVEEGDLDVDEIGKVIDLDSFFRHWALEVLIGFWDGYSANQNNYYLYFNPNDNGRAQFIPWGADWCFSSGGPFARGPFADSGSQVIYGQSMLANRLYHAAGCPERYRATMRWMLDEVWDEDEMLAELDRVEKLVSSHLHEAQAGTPQALDELRGFIRTRRDRMEQELEEWRPNVPDEPRTPSYLVDVGKMRGSFTTTFSDGAPEPSDVSKSDVEIVMDGKLLGLEQISVRAQLFRFPRFGGFGGPPGGGGGGRFGAPRGRAAEQAPPAPVSLVLTGERSEGQPVTVTVTVDREKFEAVSEDPIRVTGMFQEGRGGGGGFGGFGGGPIRFILGELRLTKSGAEQGDEVAGSLDLRIVETHGGFFQQRRSAGGRRAQPPGFGATPPAFGPAQPVALRRARNTDRDGATAAIESEPTASARKQHDQNRDGRMAGGELQSPARDPGMGNRAKRLRRPTAAEEADPQPTSPVANDEAPDPVVMTTEQDHRNMMEQLGVTKLRPGKSGDSSSPNAANSDESKANPYPQLPELMTTKGGAKVTTPEQWWEQRRPEIVEEFEREVLGRIPDAVPEVEWKVLKTIDKKLGETEVVEKRLAGMVDNSACPEIRVFIMMSLVVPKNAKQPAPVLMQFGFTMFGLDGEEFDFGGGGFGRGRGPSKEQLLVEAGWGCATVNAYSIQEDTGGEAKNRFGPPRGPGGGLTRGIIGLTNKGQPRKPDQWGALRAWAWGASRGLDYLETDPAVDAKRVGIDGVSRFGKAALVTMAFDERFATVLVGSSGEGGASLYRRNFGESLENLASTGAYHWMAGNFLKYAAEESSFGSKNASDLPVDAHMLIALCAPRPTFISYGVPEKGDAHWLDQRGSFMAAVAAQPAFRLLGVGDLGRSDNYMEEEMPPVKADLLNGQLAWRQHDGGHTDMPNIPHFIQWMQRIWSEEGAEPVATHAPADPQQVTRPTTPGGAEVPAAVRIKRPTESEVATVRAALANFTDSADTETKSVLREFPSLIDVRVPRRNSAIVPNLAPFFQQKHRSNVAVAKQGKAELLFMGDSITDFWRNESGPFAGKRVFDENFGQWDVANFGIAGDTTQGVLYRLQNGEGEGISPKAIMLMIGTNNTSGNNAAEIAEGVGAIVLDLQKRFGDAKILLLGVFPRGKANDPVREEIAEINAIIARLHDGERVHYLDIGQEFLDEKGRIPTDVMVDGLHPSAKGYAIWAKAVKAPLEKLMQE